jgi:hypothetical protein
MGVIGSLTARMVLETGEYMAAADKVVRRTDIMGGQIGRILQKAGSTYSKAMMKSIVGVFGIGMADTMVRSISENLKTNAFGSVGMNIGYALANGIADGLKSAPVAGALGEALASFTGPGFDAYADKQKSSEASRISSGGGIAGWMQDLFYSGNASGRQDVAIDKQKQQASAAQVAADITKQYERQAALISASSEEEKQALERQYEREDVIAKISEAMIKAGSDGKAVAEAQRAAAAALDKVNAAQDQAAEQARIIKEQWAEYEQIMADIQEMDEVSIMVQDDLNEREKDRVDFMRDLQNAYDASIMSEHDLFQKQLDSLGVMGEQAEKAWDLHDAMEAQKLTADATQRVQRMMGFSNVESLNTAVGGVKVAGMSSFSLERMMPTQDAIKLAVQQIAKNTAPLAAGAP